VKGTGVVNNPLGRHIKPLQDCSLQDRWLEAPLPLQALLDPTGTEPEGVGTGVFGLGFEACELIALSGMGADLWLQAPPRLSLLYVTAGDVNLTVDHGRWRASAGSCLLVPRGQLHWQSGSYSLVCMMLDWQHVSDQLALLSADSRGLVAALSGLGKPRAIHAWQGEFEATVLGAFDQTLRLLSQLLTNNPTLPIGLGLEQQLVRLVLLLAFPEVCRPAEVEPTAAAETALQTAFDALIDYIKANLDQALNLTVLERRSHYSRRTLQYAFRARFGCTATQWIRNQRLDLAHSLLSSPDPQATVASIAQACGYRSMSLFSIEFQQRFHRKPSLLLRESRTHPQA